MYRSEHVSIDAREPGVEHDAADAALVSPFGTLFSQPFLPGVTPNHFLP
jgi:hypothetical protein